jgi:molecular chaperone GrpE
MNEQTNDDHSPAAEPAGDQGDLASAAETLRREAEENWNKYVRATAELDNFRKRSARDVDQARRTGAERLAKGLLPIRDSLEAALATGAKADLKTLLDGQQATLRLLDEALTAADITEIDPHGEPFDPARHEALSMVPAPNVEPNTVIQVVQKGYQMNDRLLRAAKVIVSRGSE